MCEDLHGEVGIAGHLRIPGVSHCDRTEVEGTNYQAAIESRRGCIDERNKDSESSEELHV